MKKIPPHIFTLSFIILLNVVAVAAYIFLFTDIKDKNRHVSITLNEIEAQTQKNITDQSVRDLVMNTKADRDTIAQYILNDDQVVDFINIIEGLGPTSHTKVDTSSVDVNETGNSNTGFLTLQVKVVGDFKSIMQFAALVENLPYKISIDDVTMSASGGSASETVDAQKKKVTLTAPTWQSNFNLKVVKSKK